MTQKKWREGGYGFKDGGAAYIDWVSASIAIHKKYGLSEKTLNELIKKAPYVEGVQEFFSRLNRKEYIPIFISGGLQNLSEKACHDLGVDEDNSYASCKYFFNSKGQIDKELTFLNTSNFYGKQELVSVALRKHGLGEDDWVFIGDGINDVSVAQCAPLSVGIDPIEQYKSVADYSFKNFPQLQ